METIRELAKRGEQHEVMDALRLMTNAIWDMRSINNSRYNTVMYDAELMWQEKLAWLDLPLSKNARKCGTKAFLPYINRKVKPEILRGCDLAMMNGEEQLDCCKQIVEEKVFDEQTLEVLCWGLLKSIIKREEKQIIHTKAQDGTLIKGEVVVRYCGYTILEINEPYCVSIWKSELVRDAEKLIREAYNDILRLRSLEGEIRILYQKYREEIEQLESKNCDKGDPFERVYWDIIKSTNICSYSIRDLFKEWWGLEFYKWE